MQPTNVAMLVSSKFSYYQKDVAERVLKGDQTLEKNLVDLGFCWKIKIWFKKPVLVRVKGRRGYSEQEKTCHIFNGFGTSTLGGFMYLQRHRGRHGYYFSHDMKQAIDRYEVVFDKGDCQLTLDEFKSRIDKRFMTEAKIEEIWKDSASHNWTRKSFRRIGREGGRVLERFLQKFKGLDNTDTTHYTKSGEGKDLRWDLCEYYHSYSNSQHIGRDIKVSHLLGHPLVWWSSEYPGCGNGSYGFLATEKTWLLYEDD